MTCTLNLNQWSPYPQVLLEVMVIDRYNKASAEAEVERHLKTCKTSWKQHGEPCFLVSIAVLPDKLDNKAKSVSI